MATMSQDEVWTLGQLRNEGYNLRRPDGSQAPMMAWARVNMDGLGDLVLVAPDGRIVLLSDEVAARVAPAATAPAPKNDDEIVILDDSPVWESEFVDTSGMGAAAKLTTKVYVAERGGERGYLKRTATRYFWPLIGIRYRGEDLPAPSCKDIWLPQNVGDQMLARRRRATR